MINNLPTYANEYKYIVARRAVKDCSLVEASLFKQVRVFLGAIC